MWRRLLFLSWLPIQACSSDATPSARGSDAAIPFDAVTDAGSCGITTGSYSTEPATHVEQGSPLVFGSNPPCGGEHYGFWATWGSHATPLPRGNYIHNLEHGGIVLLYRCASRSACPELAAKLEALAASLPVDPACFAPVRNRVVVTPDPELPAGTEVAAAAWGYNLVARCYDETALRQFATQHYAHASEDTCAEGGIVGAPADAGASDATGDAAP